MSKKRKKNKTKTQSQTVVKALSVDDVQETSENVPEDVIKNTSENTSEETELQNISNNVLTNVKNDAELRAKYRRYFNDKLVIDKGVGSIDGELIDIDTARIARYIGFPVNIALQKSNIKKS